MGYLKNIFISSAALFVVMASTAFCGQESRIKLTDGSIINGEIISYAR